MSLLRGRSTTMANTRLRGSAASAKPSACDRGSSRAASGVNVSKLTKSKLSTARGLPSSRTWKSSGVSPSTIFPWSTGYASTRTKWVPPRNTGRCCACVDGDCGACPWTAQEPRDAARIPTITTTISKRPELGGGLNVVGQDEPGAAEKPLDLATVFEVQRQDRRRWPEREHVELGPGELDIPIRRARPFVPLAQNHELPVDDGAVMDIAERRPLPTERALPFEALDGSTSSALHGVTLRCSGQFGKRTASADSRGGAVRRHVVLGEHGRDVVLRATRERQIHQRPAPLVERRAPAEERRGAFVVDDVAQTVGAEQHAILPAQLELAKLYAGGPRVSADDIGEHVVELVRRRLERAGPRLGDALPQRLVVGQLRQHAAAKQVRARMTDVRQEQHVAGAVRRGQRRAHPRQVALFAGGLGHYHVDFLIETPRPVDHVLVRVGVEPELPLAEA